MIWPGSPPSPACPPVAAVAEPPVPPVDPPVPPVEPPVPASPAFSLTPALPALPEPDLPEVPALPPLPPLPLLVPPWAFSPPSPPRLLPPVPPRAPPFPLEPPRAPVPPWAPVDVVSSSSLLHPLNAHSESAPDIASATPGRSVLPNREWTTVLVEPEIEWDMALPPLGCVRHGPVRPRLDARCEPAL